MSNFLSERICQLSVSATLEMSKRTRELKAEGHDIIDLSIGEPDFNTPVSVKEAAKKAIDHNQTHYTPVSGLPELRKAIAAKLLQENRIEYAPDQIVVSNGAKQSIANAMLCLVNPGDEVVIPAPYWVSYPEIAKLAGGSVVKIPTSVESNFKVTPGQVRSVLNHKSKVFVFSSPSNPTGSSYTYEELRALAEVFAGFPNLFLISDEIYEYIIFNGSHTSLAIFPGIKNRVVTINGLSKGCAMTGWRLGYMAADAALAKACDKLQGQITSNASSISQMAAVEGIRLNPQNSSEIREMVQAFKQRRDIVLDYMKEIPEMKTCLPDGAFYIFPDVRALFGKSNGSVKITNDMDLSMYLLNEARVAVVPGAAFGNENCIRISYATSLENLEKAMRRIIVSVKKLS
ncbi:MAG: pyridoxal phosphate-dependent aminotransferase [Bacteroidales bacterium]|nr:pyridoxal phosphate-dependent aminotransferase [Bacteroidales bacterium]